MYKQRPSEIRSSRPTESLSTDKVTVLPNKSAIKEEAGLWIVRMDRRTLDEAQRAEFREWMQRSDFHREYLLQLAANWDSMAILKTLGEMFPLPEREPLRACSPSRWSRLMAWLGNRMFVPVAATVMGAFTVLLLFAGGVLDIGGTRDYVTAVGEYAEHALRDGTVVSMNTDTKLKVDFSDSRRAVFLERGEANFAVAKNPERPFVVYAGDGLVWAVGTAFNVRYVGEAVDVTVTEGRVKIFTDTRGNTERELEVHLPSSTVDAPEVAVNKPRDADHSTYDQRREALIGAGQSLRYAQTIESLESIAVEEFRRKLAWREGSLIFKGETLREVVAEIDRYTDKELIIADPVLQELRVGGHYKTDDIDSLLDSLSEGLDIDIHFASNNRVLLSAKQNSIQ